MLKYPVERAQVLAEALPYIQKFNGKTIVVKYGGNAMVSDALRNAVMSDIILLHLVGIHVVLVHGGWPDINEMLKKIGKESKFVDGLRYTDQETIDVVQEVLCGKVNKNLVAALNRHGGKALGLSGLDASLFEAKVKNPKYGLVGEITKVNPDIVLDSIEKGYIPVVSTVAQGWDAQCSYNINADTAASKLAIALGAEKLILLTDIAGLMMDPKDESTLLPIVHKEDIPKLQDKRVISGGMIPKVECCATAIARGVKNVVIMDGRVPHSILMELLTDEGAGTRFSDSEKATDRGWDS
jgi:acetylglutamate kinase